MMIFLILFFYLALAVFIGCLFMFRSFRTHVINAPSVVWEKIKSLTRKIILKTPVFTAKTTIEKHNYQHLWTIFAIFVLLTTPVLWVFSNKHQFQISDYAVENDTVNIDSSKINALLYGEQLEPPPAPPEEFFDVLDAELAQNATIVSYPTQQPTFTGSNAQAVTDSNSTDGQADLFTQPRMIKTADRKWDKMNPKYVQRLLTVFKLMKDNYGYQMVLLEGYRSPERQNRLAAQGSHVTKATGYRSYHQFGLAADCAFLKDGKILISERDPYAMQGYKLYGQLAESVGLTWGGRWKMADLGHTELTIRSVLGHPEIARQMTGTVDTSPPQ